MKYLLLLYADEIAGSKVSKEDMEIYMSQFGDWSEAMSKAGVLVTFGALQSTPKAVTVRLQQGKIVTTPGPFAETKEQLGGFYIIDTSNLDEAIEWAAKCPGAQWGSVEVRPIR